MQEINFDKLNANNKMEGEANEKLVIRSIVPARAWYYLYAYTDKRPIFIYAHRDRVEFFATHEAEDISKFQDTVTKLSAVKYFNEKSENCIGNLASIDFENETDTLIKFGTCLVSFDLMENYKADVWVNNKEKTIEFHLKDAGEFKNIRTSEIILPDLKEDERLAAKEATITTLKESSNEQLVSLIEEQPKFFKKLFSFGFAFTPKQLEEFQDELDWSEVSANSQINWTPELINTFSDHLNWETLIKNHSTFWNENNIDRFKDKINWEAFSGSTAINWTPSLIEKYHDKVSWRTISRNESIPWTSEFILKNKSKLNIESLSGNKSVPWSIELMEELKSEIKNWNFISSNAGKFWTEAFVEKYVNEINWNYADNPSIPLSFQIIEKNTQRIGWTNASKNQNLPWTAETIEKYKDELAFGWLSENPGLPWSFELINKYADKWNWSNLGSNSAIPWTEKFIEDNLEKFQNFNGTWSLWQNKGLPQTESFWIKHKEILFPSHKGSGLMRVIDASKNETIPLSLNLVFELKDNLDWNGYFYQNVKQNGKYKILLAGFSIDLFDTFVKTKHF